MCRVRGAFLQALALLSHRLQRGCSTTTPRLQERLQDYTVLLSLESGFLEQPTILQRAVDGLANSSAAERSEMLKTVDGGERKKKNTDGFLRRSFCTPFNPNLNLPA